MLTIDYLANHHEYIELLAKWRFEQWKHLKITNSVDEAIAKLKLYINTDTLPIGIIAFENNVPVGMAAIRKSDGIREDLEPWFGSIYVEPNYRKKGVGASLVEWRKQIVVNMGYSKAYILVIEQEIIEWYLKLGWKIHSFDKLKGHDVTIMEIDLSS
ncbi:MAG: acetyltransferase [Rickettsiaceae bacterium]|jgi:GNAT superfamily N-acetyltransferase|nr:acetyltransferase [Rickettsiaceae bacterium]